MDSEQVLITYPDRTIEIIAVAADVYLVVFVVFEQLVVIVVVVMVITITTTEPLRTGGGVMTLSL